MLQSVMSSHAASGMSSVKRHGSMSSSHPRGHHGDLPHHELSHTLPAHHHYDAEWEAKEELRLRELEEARARAAQMEKTMRWWSDCTANWREKWSKVRTERNKSREECRLLRTKLESSVKECNHLKRDKQEMEATLDLLRKELEQVKLSKSVNLNHSLPSDGLSAPERDICVKRSEGDKAVHELLRLELKLSPRELSPNDLNQDVTKSTDTVVSRFEKVQTSPVVQNAVPFEMTPDMEFLDRLLQPKPEKDMVIEEEEVSKDASAEPVGGSQENEVKTKVSPSKIVEELSLSPQQEYAEQRVSMLQLRLDEATKTIQVEREEKSSLHKCLEKLQQELSRVKVKYDDLKQIKQEALKEVVDGDDRSLNQVKTEHQDELESIRLDLEDEANSRSSMDRRLADLRAQLETLQAENAAEWGKRERLETEKLTLERENKKLRTQIEDLEERLERKNKQFTAAADSDMKALQQDIHDKNKDDSPGNSAAKELAELKYAHNKLKKVLQDKTTELGHAIRRAEQYESEVKKLRSRVEELKKELAIAEDEVDSATNNIRKLQRTNDELQEQAENLQVQVEHLQTRLRSTNHSLIARRGSTGLLQADNLSEDDNTEY